jgi:hypothetical protein
MMEVDCPMWQIAHQQPEAAVTTIFSLSAGAIPLAMKSKLGLR